jgi:hypothetical protein
MFCTHFLLYPVLTRCDCGRLGIDGVNGDACGFGQHNLGKRYGFLSLPRMIFLRISELWESQSFFGVCMCLGLNLRTGNHKLGFLNFIRMRLWKDANLTGYSSSDLAHITEKRM